MLHVHRAERADRLVAALGTVLAEPLEDALAADLVAVPTRGIERWLTQQLSTVLGTSPGRGDGVCANVSFPFPARLVGGAVASATGVERESDPWLPERAVWPLLELVDAHHDEHWLRLLATHLTAGVAGQRTRRFSVIRALADRYDRYGIHRPAMVRAWAAGADTDTSGAPLASDVVWQAELWRLLRAAIGVPSPAERLDRACTTLREQPGVADLPARLALFGLTRLPASYLAVLDALAAGRDVHLFLLHPSNALWERIAATADAAAPLRRSADPTAALPRNPLLGSWGRDGREMQLVVAGVPTAARGHHHLTDAPPPTLLGRLQEDVRSDQAPPGAPPASGRDRRALLDPLDDSVQVHACHSRARQVEVLRDAILHLLSAHPKLEPRDVVVMCPDIETFAPLIQATFGPVGTDGPDEGLDEAAGDGPRPRGLRVRLADRSLRQTNPVLQVLADVLELADARLTASQVLDLAAREPVRRRFRLSAGDLERLEGWAADSGVRWGLDAAHRRPYALEGVAQNTWRAGLDRLLLGAAMDESELPLIGGVLPLDDVGSADIDLAGRFAELLARLGAALDQLQGAKPITAWTKALGAVVDELVATTESDVWQQAQLQRLLADVAGEASTATEPTTGRSPAQLDLAEVRSLLADRLRGRPTVTSFRTGHLTICTLVPMRSVPHKVIGVLGLDDGWFPRPSAPDGDDLVARDPHVGDRDPRSEDRQLLLDALLAATDHLVVTYTGRDQRTNLPRPPSVPLGELLDAIDGTVRTGEVAPGGGEVPARQRICIHHPLQPFDPRNFATGSRKGEVPAPWSYDEVALAGARALAAGPSAPPPFLSAPLPPAAATHLDLADLERFVQHPVKAFLRQRLLVSLVERGEEPDDGLPIELDALEQWQIGQRLLDVCLAGGSLDRALAAEHARGSLPPGALATRPLERVVGNVERIAAEARRAVAGAGAGASMDIRVAGGGDASFLLTGTVPQVHGDVLLQVTYSSLAARHRLTSWVRLLAATAAAPDRSLAAVTVGRGRGVAVARIPSLADRADARRRIALDHLRTVIDLHRRGLREPLPLSCRTSAAYAAARVAGEDPLAAARGEWQTGRSGPPREDVDAEHVLVHGGVVPFDRLLDPRPGADERGTGWADDEDSRFGRYARRLWQPLLAVEELT